MISLAAEPLSGKYSLPLLVAWQIYHIFPCKDAIAITKEALGNLA
jgi:hypothetical protein